MHPREGWTEDRRAGGLSRRGFLTQGAAAGLLAAGSGSLLAGCSSGTTTTSGAHMSTPPNTIIILAGTKGAIRTAFSPPRSISLSIKT